MSSSKGSSNSNKTAHVMNLLRKSNPPAQSQTAKPEVPSTPDTPAAPAAPAPTPQVPPILTSLHADAEVSSQIRDALADALEEEIQPPAATSAEAEAAVPVEPVAPVAEPVPPQAAPEPVQEAAAELPVSEPVAEAPAPVQEAAPIPEPAPVPEAPATPVQEAAPVSAPAAQAPATPIAGAIPPEPMGEQEVFINVMHYLTNEKADKYIRLFGLCDCPRCRSDVVALALNHLEPKYVVMRPSDFRIRSDMYASRYASEITAQLLWACKAVMDNPRH